MSLGLWLVAGTAAAADPLTCPFGKDDAVTPPNDLKEVGRINQGFNATTCTDKVNPPEVIGGQYSYKSYLFRNWTSQNCIDVTLTAKANSQGVFAVGYNGQFDATNVATNYAGSPSSPVFNGASQHFQINIAPLNDFTIVVNEITDGVGGQYHLDVNGCGQNITLSSVQPNFGPTAGGKPTVTIKGTGFETIRGGSQVQFGTAAGTNVTVADGNTLTVTPPAYPPGPSVPPTSHVVNVTVTNPSGLADTKNNAYTYWDKQSSTVSLKSGAATSVYGQAVTLTAHVTPASAQPEPPTGTVTFLDGATPIAQPVPINGNGDAVLTVSTLAALPAAHSLTARYSGDDFFDSSTSAPPVLLLVSKANTTIVVNTSGSPSIVNQPVTFTATVTAVAPGGGAATGNVTFQDTFGGQTTPLGSKALVANGSAAEATLTISTLLLGTHQITVSYQGDSNFNGSSEGPPGLTQIVKTVATTVKLTSSANPSIFGDKVTFSAVVTATAGGPATTGAVQFVEVTGTNTEVPLGQPVAIVSNSNGTATVSTGAGDAGTGVLSIGTHTIKATYTDAIGGANDTANASISQVVKAATSIELTSSKNPSVVRDTVTFTVTVGSTYKQNALTGSVQLLEGTKVLGTGTLDINGIAKIQVSTFTAGPHPLTAVYAGNTTFATVTSSPVLTQTVTATGDGGVGQPDAGTGFDAGTPGNGFSTTEGGGCNCDTASAPTSGFMALVSGLGLAMMMMRRRRR